MAGPSLGKPLSVGGKGKQMLRFAQDDVILRSVLNDEGSGSSLSSRLLPTEIEGLPSWVTAQSR